MIRFVKLYIDPTEEHSIGKYSDITIHAIDSFEEISEKEYNNRNKSDDIFKIESIIYHDQDTDIDIYLDDIIPKYCNNTKKLCKLLENPEFVEEVYQYRNPIRIMYIIDTKITNITFVRVIYDDDIKSYFEIHNDDVTALYPD
jgi:hypothetical protein